MDSHTTMRQAFSYYERRRYPRQKLKLWIRYQIVNPGTKPIPVQSSLTEDLSAGGICMLSDQPLQSHGMVFVLLFLPPEEKRRALPEILIYPPEQCQSVGVLCRVAWSIRQSDLQYKSGLEFLDMKWEEKRILKSFLVDYKLDDPDSPALT